MSIEATVIVVVYSVDREAEGRAQRRLSSSEAAELSDALGLRNSNGSCSAL